MSDALSLLRNFVKNKKEFHEDDDKIIFGDQYYPKNVKTTYLIYGTGKDGRPKDYYTLECLAFLIKNRDLQHPMYVKNAGTRNISVVSRPDRRELLMYLDGEIETTPSIDKNAPLEITMQRPFPFIKPVGNKRNLAMDDEKMDTSDNSKLNKLANESEEQVKADESSSKLFQHTSSKKEQFIGRLTKKFDESAEQSTRPITQNIMDLSEELTKEKIAAIKAKKKAQQRKQVGVELDDDLLTDINKSKEQDHSVLKSQADYSQIDRDDNDAIMKEITQRESVTRTRFTVLQSTGKQFEKDINAFFQLIKAKEDSQNELSNTQSLQFSQASQVQAQKSRQLGYNRFDQERYAGKDETGGFSIDTKLTYQPNGGALSLTQNSSSSQSANSSSSQVSARLSANSHANGSVKATQEVSSQLSQNKTNIMSKSPVNSSSKKVYVKPIIIIPAITSSLITMSNVVDILQDLKYVSVEEKRKMSQNQNAPKDSEIIIHRKEDGSTLQFKVIDNVNKLLPQDWDRVVAVFALGKQWQFKDWPLGYTNPVEIFSKVKGFHLKMTGMPIDPNIAKWSINIIELDPHKRHLDRARLLAFWDELDKFMLKSKPYLCR